MLYAFGEALVRKNIILRLINEIIIVQLFKLVDDDLMNSDGHKDKVSLLCIILNSLVFYINDEWISFKANGILSNTVLLSLMSNNSKVSFFFCGIYNNV